MGPGRNLEPGLVEVAVVGDTDLEARLGRVHLQSVVAAAAAGAEEAAGLGACALAAGGDGGGSARMARLDAVPANRRRAVRVRAGAAAARRRHRCRRPEDGRRRRGQLRGPRRRGFETPHLGGGNARGRSRWVIKRGYKVVEQSGLLLHSLYRLCQYWSKRLIRQHSMVRNFSRGGLLRDEGPSEGEKCNVFF